MYDHKCDRCLAECDHTTLGLCQSCWDEIACVAKPAARTCMNCQRGAVGDSQFCGAKCAGEYYNRRTMMIQLEESRMQLAELDTRMQRRLAELNDCTDTLHHDDDEALAVFKAEQEQVHLLKLAVEPWFIDRLDREINRCPGYLRWWFNLEVGEGVGGGDGR